MQVVKEVETDAESMKRCEEKRKDWAGHWQCDAEVSDMEDKPWRNEEIKSLEEGLPRLTRENLESAAWSYEAATGVGSDGFHPKGYARRAKRNEGRNGEVFSKQCSSAGECRNKLAQRWFSASHRTSRAKAPSRFCRDSLVGVVAGA